MPDASGADLLHCSDVRGLVASGGPPTGNGFGHVALHASIVPGLARPDAYSPTHELRHPVQPPRNAAQADRAVFAARKLAPKPLAQSQLLQISREKGSDWARPRPETAIGGLGEELAIRGRGRSCPRVALVGQPIGAGFYRGTSAWSHIRTTARNMAYPDRGWPHRSRSTSSSAGTATTSPLPRRSHTLSGRMKQPLSLSCGGRS
jgi:hypothetical protein